MNEATFCDPAPPRGMRDFYPEQAARRDHLFALWTRAAQRYGFVRYDACPVESLALLKRKAGEEIVDQIYAFSDKSGRDLALRPEMTPTLARMVCARWNELSFPLKWFAIAQCFRYERSSRGRKREHFQWNLDILGADGPDPEIEILATALSAIEDLGLADAVRVHISNRALLGDLLIAADIPPERHADLFLVLDKRGKLSDDAIAGMLTEYGFGPDLTARVLGLFQLDGLDAVGRKLGAETAALAHTRSVFAGLAAYGLRDRVLFDLSIVRGLNYYTGTVFEAFDTERHFRAVFGGGRYDNLLGNIGGRPTPAVGLGFGDVVITEIMQARDSLPPVPPPAELMIGYLQPEQAAAARQATRHYRSQGKSVDLAMAPEKARAFFGRAGRSGARQAMLIGPDDLQSGLLRLKDLENRQETVLALDKIKGTPE